MSDEDEDEFPLTPKQEDAVRQEFISSLLPSKIESLASSYRSNMACHVFGHKNGSFNVCFFVQFDDGVVWVVRVPIEASLHQAWEKLQSEVATIQYLEQRTDIPVPHIQAYGSGVALTEDSSSRQMFVISDFIAGDSLTKQRLHLAKAERKAAFYRQLITILAELRSLEFPKIGSLMPGPDPGEPMVGDLLTIPANALHRKLPRYGTASMYMNSQFDIIRDQIHGTVADYDEDDSRNDLFALSNLEKCFRKLIDPEFDSGPFVLSHCDLRHGNIVVDDRLNIKGIIDWEFAAVIPIQLSLPPSWATGCEPDVYTSASSTAFHQAVQEAAKENADLDKLKTEWYKPHAARIAHVIRYPSDLCSIFYESDVFSKSIAEEMYGDGVDAATAAFFAKSPMHTIDARLLSERSLRYTEYLKRENLYQL